MMDAAPKITIGICCYRSADTVAQAIASALAQDWPNLEILIIDDSPGDGTAEVARAAIAGCAFARIIPHPENRGFAAALNTVIAEAAGEFIAIFDDDDVSTPDRVRRQYERIIQYERDHGVRDIVCHAARMQHYPDGLTRYESTMGTGDGLAPHGRDVADRILIGRLSSGVTGSCANCSRLARTEIFRSMNGFDTGMRRAEDTDFNIRFALNGGHFVGIADPLVDQAMTMGVEKKLDAEEAAEKIVLDKHRDYLRSIGWEDFCRTWLEIRYHHYRDENLKMLSGILALFLRSPVKVMQKIVWMLPARATRNSYKTWHQATEKDLAA